MNHLFFDTETTGIPDWHTPSDDPGQPHILELAAVLTDDDLVPVNTVNLVVRPEGWEITPEITEHTGITAEYAERFGVSEGLAVDALLEMWGRSSAVTRVAHNEPFDARIIRIALKRSGASEELLDAWKSAPRFCTLSKSKKLINLPPTEKMIAANIKGPKAPTLAEAYEHFIGTPFEGAHRALADVNGLIEVYRHLRAALAEQEAA